MNILAIFKNDPWKFTDVRALTVIFCVQSCKEIANGDFPCAKLQNAKKIRQIFFLPIMKKPRIYTD